MVYPADKEKMFELLASRHTPDVQEKLAAGRVAVAGLGGLGSHVALSLARCGVGSLLLVDFDSVDESNLHRQQYFPCHIGRLKTEALAEMVAEINPFINIRTAVVRLSAENIPDVLKGWPLIVEALDNPQSKSELVTTALAFFPEVKVVCASGLAGLESANLIVSRQVGRRLYLCGDEQSETGEGVSLMAPRVMVCAGHQANLAVRLLMNFEKP